MVRPERKEAKEIRDKLFSIIKEHDGEISGYDLAMMLCLEETGRHISEITLPTKLPNDYPHNKFVSMNSRISRHLNRMMDLGDLTRKEVTTERAEDKWNKYLWMVVGTVRKGGKNTSLSHPTKQFVKKKTGVNRRFDD